MIRKNCKLRKVKGIIRTWFTDNTDGLIAVAIMIGIVFAIITGLVWLFGDKVTSVCHEGKDFRVNGTRTLNYTWYDGSVHPIELSNWEEYVNDCAYSTTSYSRYTIPESMLVEFSWIAGALGGFWGWLASHPVI
jgi:hypothetical protein